MDERKADIDGLTAQALDGSDYFQQELGRRLESLGTQAAEGRNNLSALSEASDDAWESLPIGLETTWDSFKKAISKKAT